MEEVLYLIISANLRRLEKLMSFNEVHYLMISANLRRLEKTDELQWSSLPDDFSELAALGEIDELQ